MRLHEICPKCNIGKLRCKQTKPRRNWRIRHLECDHCSHRGKEVYQLGIAAIPTNLTCPCCASKLNVDTSGKVTLEPHE